MKDIGIHAQGSGNAASEENFAASPSEETLLFPLENVIPHCTVLLVPEPRTACGVRDFAT